MRFHFRDSLASMTIYRPFFQCHAPRCPTSTHRELLGSFKFNYLFSFAKLKLISRMLSESSLRAVRILCQTRLNSCFCPPDESDESAGPGEDGESFKLFITLRSFLFTRCCAVLLWCSYKIQIKNKKIMPGIKRNVLRCFLSALRLGRIKVESATWFAKQSVYATL